MGERKEFLLRIKVEAKWESDLLCYAEGEKGRKKKKTICCSIAIVGQGVISRTHSQAHSPPGWIATQIIRRHVVRCNQDNLVRLLAKTLIRHLFLSLFPLRYELREFYLSWKDRRCCRQRRWDHPSSLFTCSQKCGFEIRGSGIFDSRDSNVCMKLGPGQSCRKCCLLLRFSPSFLSFVVPRRLALGASQTIYWWWRQRV